MAPQTGTALLVLVVFVMPGFVALRYAEQTYRTRAEDSPLERVLSALYFSLLTYLVLGAVAVFLADLDRSDVSELWRGRRALWQYLVFAVAATIVPLAIAELARRWTASQVRLRLLRLASISTAHKTPSGWEHFFLQGRLAYVRATLKDGRVVAGYYGTGSFAGYTAEAPDLYLEQRFQLDDNDWFAGPAAGTIGVYIRADEIVSLEFYEAGISSPRSSWIRRLISKIKTHGDGKLTAPDDASDSEARRSVAGRIKSAQNDPAAPTAD